MKRRHDSFCAPSSFFFKKEHQHKKVNDALLLWVKSHSRIIIAVEVHIIPHDTMRFGCSEGLTRLTKFLPTLLLTTSTFAFPIAEITTRRGAIQRTATSVTTLATSMSSSKTQSNDSINWGIVGLGDVCQKKAGPPFWKCNGSELVAVMRRTPGKAEEFAAKNVPGGKCVGYQDIEEFLQHPGLDAVYVSTRPGTHLEICRKVARAGKACYVEKPVGRCADETREILGCFRESGMPLYTAYISRAYEKTQAIKKLMEEGAIGDRVSKVLYKVIGNGGARDMDGDLPWRLDAEQSGGGLIMDVGCHVIDRIDYLCGPLQNIKGEAANRNSPGVAVEDYVHFTADIGAASWTVLSNNEGATVECTWDFASSESPYDELQFIGPKGSLRMKGSPSDPINVHDANGEFVRQLDFEMPEHTGQALVQGVTDDLRGGNTRDFLSFGENAIRTQTVLDTVLSSYYGGREQGYWTRMDTWPGRSENE